jgi:hypothetical protein
MVGVSLTLLRLDELRRLVDAPCVSPSLVQA